MSSTPEVLIVDYGMGNLFSVSRAFEHCGARAIVSARPEDLMTTSRIVLPGVGAFGDGMKMLKREGMDVAIKDAVRRGANLLGICLGMQMLLEESEEFGLTRGLGLIPGKVVAIPSVALDGKRQKVPHVGWNSLVGVPDGLAWKNTVLENVSEGDSAYFVHSFMAMPTSLEHRIADTIYGGAKLAAVVGRDNVQGTQFHPEKSGEVGLRIIRSFLNTG